MNTNTNSINPPTRLYELDWLRTAAIILVVFYHTGMFFNSWSYHINTANPVKSIEPLMVWMHCWRMPLLLFISGIGTAFSVRRRTIRGFLAERHNRLMIPLVFSMFVIVPPQIYIEQIDQFSSYLAFYPKVFEFQSYPPGAFSWHHMWFVLYLFLFSVLSVPLVMMLKSRKFAWLDNAFSKMLTCRGAFIIAVALSLVSDILLRRYWPENTHGLFDDWAGFAHYFLFFIFGYLCMATEGVWEAIKRDRWLYTVLAVIFVTLLEYAFIKGLPRIEINHYHFTWGFLKITTGWFTLLALVGHAQCYLRRKSNRLQRWNEASYPVYILHQTILIITAHFFIHSTLPWPVQYLFVFLVSLVGSFLIYQFVIKDINVLRILFGLKMRRKTRKDASGNVQQSPKELVSVAES